MKSWTEQTHAMQHTYAVVFERAPNNYAAYCPDVLGCVSVGDDWPEMLAMIREALTFHIELMLEHGEEFPEPTMSVVDAMRYHCDLDDEEDLWEDGEPEPSTEVTVAMVEIEINVAAATGAAETAGVGD